MTNVPVRRWWVAGAIVPMTYGWIVALLALGWKLFTLGMQGWANQTGRSGIHVDEINHRAAVTAMVFASVAVGGPALIAILAFAIRAAKTGVVYSVLAAVIGLLVLTPALHAGRTLFPPAVEHLPTGPPACQEHSGSDNSCPGN